MNCITDEAARRAKDGIVRPGWPLLINDWRAIATEAGTAETTQIGSVHEGAGPQDIAQEGEA